MAKPKPATPAPAIAQPKPAPAPTTSLIDDAPVDPKQSERVWAKIMNGTTKPTE